MFVFLVNAVTRKYFLNRETPKIAYINCFPQGSDARLLLVSTLSDLNIALSWSFWWANKDNETVPDYVKDGVLIASCFGTWTWFNCALHDVPGMLVLVPFSLCLQDVCGQRPHDAFFDWVTALASGWLFVFWEFLLSNGPILYFSIATCRGKAGELFTCGDGSSLAVLNIVSAALDIGIKVADVRHHNTDQWEAYLST